MTFLCLERSERNDTYYEKTQAYYDSGKNEVYFIENECYSNRKRRRRIGANFFHEPLSVEEIYSFTLQVQEENGKNIMIILPL